MSTSPIPSADIPSTEVKNSKSESTQKASAPKTFLEQRLGKEGIDKAITLLRNDRFSSGTELTKFLKEKFELPEISEKLIQNDPLLSMLVLILNENSSEDLRKRAAESYKANHPEDKRFEKAYAYLKEPHVLIAHLLISTDQWKCANPENIEFYDEQIASLLQGNMVFDVGDRLTPEELKQIQQQEGKDPRFPIADKITNKESYFEVDDWCSTPQMCSSEKLNDLFIDSRRKMQEGVVNKYLDSLKATSPIIQKFYNLDPKLSAVVAHVGPYGAGKSTLTQQRFSNENIAVFHVDKLNTLLKDANSSKQDHHFEAMVLTRKFLSGLADVPVVFTEIAAIDEYRFNRLVNRDFSSREQIVIEEIAPEEPSDAVKRLFSIEGNNVDQSRLDLANTSANDALKFRSGRIEMAKENSKIRYTLYCNKSADANKNVEFIKVAKVQDGKVTITKGQEKLFKTLTPKA